MLSPYLWIMLLLVGLIYPYEKAGERVRVVVWWGLLNLFVLFFGLRGCIGNDYPAYQQYYRDLFLPDTPHHEPAFAALAMALRALHLPFQCFVFACSCIINVLLFRFVWQQRLNAPLVLCVFWAMSGIINQIDFTRSTISIMLFANALPYLERRQAGRYFALTGLACLFHYVAVVYLPLYFLLHRRLQRQHYLTAVLLLTVMAMLHLRFLDLPFELIGTGSEDSLIAHYRQYVTLLGGLQLGFSIAAVERLLTAALVIVCYDRLCDTPRGRMAANGFLVFYLCYTLLSGYAVMATRLANMFVWSYWLVWPLSLLSIGQVRVRRGVLGVMLAYMLMRVWGVAHVGKMNYATCFG